MNVPESGKPLKTCPLCASTCEVPAIAPPEDDVRPGFTTVRCSARCGEYLISPDSVETLRPEVKAKLAWLARLLRKEDRGVRLEVTPDLVLVLSDICSSEARRRTPGPGLAQRTAIRRT